MAFVVFLFLCTIQGSGVMLASARTAASAAATFLHLLVTQRTECSLVWNHDFWLIWHGLCRRLPWSLHTTWPEDRLVQFCHGATGMVSLGPTGLLMKNFDLSNGTRIIRSSFYLFLSKKKSKKQRPQIHRFGTQGGGSSSLWSGCQGASVENLRIHGFWGLWGACYGAKVWIRGLLRKGLGLCHGIPGNGFALLKLHPTGGEIPIFGSISVVFFVCGKGKCGWIVRCISQSLQWSGALKSRHLLVVQEKLNKPRLWMFGLQHYAFSRITRVQTTTSFVVLLQA